MGRAYGVNVFIIPYSDLELEMLYGFKRMAENDRIVTRYMDDASFQKTIFPILAKEIYRSILEKQE
jgi:hypothetical protein